MGVPLLLDEMLSGAIAEQLRARGHDVMAVVADPSLTGLPDDEVLAAAVAAGRAVVTVNIRDFVPLDQRDKSSGRTHAGLVFMSAKTFTQDRAFTGAAVSALDRQINEDTLRPDAVVFLQR